MIRHYVNLITCVSQVKEALSGVYIFCKSAFLCCYIYIYTSVEKVVETVDNYL